MFWWIVSLIFLIGLCILIHGVWSEHQENIAFKKFVKESKEEEEELEKRFPKERQVLNLQTASKKGDSDQEEKGPPRLPTPLTWDEARSLVRSFIRRKEQEYQHFGNNHRLRYIYIKTDEGQFSSYGYSVLRSQIENYLFDNGYRFEDLTFEPGTMKVDLEKSEVAQGVSTTQYRTNPKSS